jgi:hypothetical protein
MGRFADRGITIKNSLTLERVIAVPILFGVITGVDRLASLIAAQRGAMLAGVPGWAWATLAVSWLLLGFMIEYATRLRLSLIPKLALSFNPLKEGIVQTPIEVPVQGSISGQVLIKEYRASYVRIRIDALSKTTVKGCAAYLTKIEKRRHPGEAFVEVPLSADLLLTPTPIDVPPKVRGTVDFLTCNDLHNKLVLSTPAPFTMRDIFDEPGTYRITIVVIAGDIDKTIQVEIDWSSKWDMIVGRQIAIS